MSSNFDCIAPVYVRVDEHWGSDLDLLKAAVATTIPRRPSVRYLDVGCGSGFHLAFMKHLYPEICGIGIDSSDGMLKEAYVTLGRLGCHDAMLIRADIGQFWSPMRFNVVTFLNNGLGNLYAEPEKPAVLREQAVQKVRSLMPGGDLFVISVYNLERFDCNYGRETILTKRDDIAGDFKFEYRPRNSGVPAKFDSHWFTEKELRELLERCGFAVELLEKRMARFVAMARAV